MNTSVIRRAVIVSVLLVLVFMLANTVTAELKKPFAGVTINCMMEPHPSTDALQIMKKEFEDKTGAKVVFDVVAWGSANEKVHILGSTHSRAYDVYFDNFPYRGVGWAKAGYIIPLDQFIKRPASKNPYLTLDDYVPTFLDLARWQGKIWGLPIYGEGTYLMYRKDLFAKYGVAVPKTLDELRAAAQKLTVDTNGDGRVDLFGITQRGRRGGHIMSTWVNYFFAFGGEFFDKNMRPTLNSKAGVQAVEYYVDLLKNCAPTGVGNFGWEESHQAFMSGIAAMNIDATLNGGLIEDPASPIAGKVGYAPFPKGPADKGGAVYAHSLYINANSRNKEAAWQFISWATSTETQMKILKDKKNAHAGLTSQKALTSDAYKEKYGAFMDAAFEAIKNGNPNVNPKIPECAEFVEKTGIAVSEVLAGTKTAKEALDDLNKDIYNMLNSAGYYDK